MAFAMPLGDTKLLGFSPRLERSPFLRLLLAARLKARSGTNLSVVGLWKNVTGKHGRENSSVDSDNGTR